MKKLMAVFAAVLLTLVGLPASPARGQAEALQRFTDLPLQCSLLTQDAAFALDTDGVLWRWPYDAAQPVPYATLPAALPLDGLSAYAQLSPEERAAARETVQLLAPSPSGQLYALNVYAGRVGVVSPQGVTWTEVTFDPAPLFSSDGWPLPLLGRPQCLADGRLLLLAECWDRMDFTHWNYAQALLLDPSTGATRLLDAPDTIAGCMHQEKLLLLCSAATENGTQENSLSLLDLDSGESSPFPGQLPDGNAGAMACDEQGKIVLTIDSDVYLLDRNGSAQLTANAWNTQVTAYSQGLLLPDGRYATTGSGITVLPLPQEPPQPLTVQWAVPDAAMAAAFQAAHPEVLVQLRRETMSCAQVAQRIQGGDNATDIFCVTVDAGFGVLMDKGFTVPLEDCQAIVQSVADMYEPFRELLTDNAGHIAAYPVSLRVNLWSVNQELWIKHFGDTPLPDTWAGMLANMLTFESAEDQDGDLFLSQWDYAEMVRLLLWSFLQQSEDDSADLTDLSLAQCLDLLLQIRAVKGVDHLSSEEVYPASEVGGSEYVLLGINWAAYDSRLASLDSEADSMLLPLTFHGETPTLPVDLQVLVVNPLSPRQALAQAFIAQAAIPENGLIRYAMLHASATEPVYRTSELTGRTYAVISPQGLESWRKVVPCLRFYARSGLIRDDVEALLESCVQRYIGGQLRQQEMLAELDRMIAMAQLENQ